MDGHSPHSTMPFRLWKVWQLAMHSQMKMSGSDTLREGVKPSSPLRNVLLGSADAFLQGNST